MTRAAWCVTFKKTLHSALYTASLHSLENSNTKIFQFADDFIILSHAKNFDLAASFLNQTVNLFKNNCKELNLSFNLEKNKYSLFCSEQVLENKFEN